MRSESMSKTSPTPVRSTIRIWCYASVPYLLLYSVLVILLRPTPGMLAHIFFPFVIAFWLALYICIAWTIVTFVRVVMARQIARSRLAMLLASLAASVIGLYVEFLWPGNVG